MSNHAHVRKPYKRCTSDERNAALEMLQKLLVGNQEDATKPDGLTEADYDNIAERFGVARRTVQGWWSKHISEEGDATADDDMLRITKDHWTTISTARNRKDAWVDLTFEGAIPPRTYSQFCRALKRDIPPAVLAGLLGGTKPMNKHELEPRVTVEHLNEVWHLDLWQVDVPCADDDGSWVTSAWYAVIIDNLDRAIVAEQLFDHEPDSEEIIAVVGKAVRGTDYDGVHIGGRNSDIRIRTRLRPDNQSIFTSEEALGRIGQAHVRVDPTNSYSSNENGRIERFFQLIQDEALGVFGGSTGGPIGRDKKLHWPADGESPVPTFDTIARTLTEYVHHYNVNHSGRFNDGLSPRAFREKHAEEVEQVEDFVPAALGMLRTYKDGTPRPYKRHDAGIFYGERYFMHPELRDYPEGTEMNIRVFPGADYVAVYEDGASKFVCMARHDVPAEMHLEIQRDKATDRRSVEFALAEGRRRKEAVARSHMVKPDGPKPGASERREARAEAAARGDDDAVVAEHEAMGTRADRETAELSDDTEEAA